MTNTTKSEQTFSDTQHLSLEDRILRMAATDNSDLPEFPDDKSDLPSDFEYNPEEYDDPEEVVEEISESDMLKYLEQQEPALSVAQRLFYHELNTTESQKQSETWDLHCLTPKAVEELYSKGWTEVENIIDLSILKGAHEEAEKFAVDHKFIPANEFGENDPYRDNSARDDAILWLNSENQTNNGKGFVDAPPHLKKLIDFIDGSIRNDLSKMIRLIGQSEHQLSYFHENEAHYERHRDAFPTDDPEDKEQRRVSIIFYLNPGWSSSDGGEIRIPDDQGLPEVADRIVKPLIGRALIFLSGVIDYEVLPTRKHIFNLTTWMK